jgi:hypothetical protein
MVDALDHADELLGGNDTLVMNGAAAGRWLLEQPAVQEPVAYQLRHPNVNFGNWYTVDMERHRRATKDFERRELVVANTSPPAPQPVPVKTYHDGKPWPVAPKPWVGLTKEDKEDFWTADQMTNEEWEQLFAKIETKLKEKNT